jgi:hypothetical protein
MANTITLNPDPPKANAPFTICYHWDNPVPGQVVNIVVTYAFNQSGSFSAEFVCPEYGDMCCKSYVIPSTAIAGGEDGGSRRGTDRARACAERPRADPRRVLEALRRRAPAGPPGRDRGRGRAGSPGDPPPPRCRVRPARRGDGHPPGMGPRVGRRPPRGRRHGLPRGPGGGGGLSRLMGAKSYSRVW